MLAAFMYTDRMFSLIGHRSFHIVCVLAAFCFSSSAQQRTPSPGEFVQWLPISDADRQLKSPQVESDAGAEVLMYRVHVVDEILGNNRDWQRVFYHYVRLKVFDQKGMERASTIDLQYGNNTSILDVSGHTVKADGSIVELDRKTVYKRDVVRGNGIRRKAVSFAMPGVEPGAILEYRWKESRDNGNITYLRLEFQREFPVERVTYFVRPLPSAYTNYQMFIYPFNCKTSAFKQESDGYSSTFVESVPAAHEEPFAPSEPNLRPWALLLYRMGNRNDPDKYWNDMGRKAYGELKSTLKTNDEMKTATLEAIAGAKSDDEKAVALITYLRKTLRSVSDSSVPDAERARFYADLPKERARTSTEIFKNKLAMADEMNVVFAAMALQAGLEARPIFVADRGELAFNPKGLPDQYFLKNIDMAVKTGDSWKVYDVAQKQLTPGLLSWREEGVFALLSDPKNPQFIQTPFAPAEASLEGRVAQLTLSAEGTLEGDVQESFTGHKAEDYRDDLTGKSGEQREEWLKERITRMFPDAEATMANFENIENPTRPLQIRYHLNAERFAQVTGKRILFQPIAFRRAIASPFFTAERRFPVEFPYGWKESDQLTFKLPTGFVLDNADSPGSISFGQTGGYKLELRIGNNELTVLRELTFGSNGLIYFEAKNYDVVKKVFDEIHTRDRYSLSLREGQ